MRLGDCCKTNLHTYSDKEKWSLIRYLDTGSITEGRIDEIQTLYPGVDKIPSRARRKASVGDILFSTVRPNQKHYGIIEAGTENLLVSTGFTVVTVDTTIADPYFIYYYLTQSSVIESLQAIAEQSTSTYPSIKPSDIEDIELDLPELETQKKIGSTLRMLDRKIALNEEINDNLQQQATAFFSSLYDRSNTEVRFTDLIQILGGGTPKTGESTYWNGNIAFFTPKDVGTPYTLITEKTISEEGLSHCNSRLYPVNTVFVTARGTVGKVGISGVPMAMNQSCYALVGKETHQLLVYFYTLKAVDRLKHKASGAVFDAITTRDFESEQIMKLSDDDAKAFLCIAEPMFQKVLNNCIENLRLSTLRDSLLPKLMSGEIDVSAIQL